MCISMKTQGQQAPKKATKETGKPTPTKTRPEIRRAIEVPKMMINQIYSSTVLRAKRISMMTKTAVEASVPVPRTSDSAAQKKPKSTMMRSWRTTSEVVEDPKIIALQRHVAGPQDELVVNPDSGTDRLFKIIYGLYGVVVYCALAIYSSRLTLNFLCTMGVFLGTAPLGIMWLYFLCTTTNLHQVHIPTARIEGWMPMSVPHSVEVSKNHTAHSISCLSSIRGSQAHLMLRVTSEIACAVIFICIQQDLQYRQAEIFAFNDKHDIIPACLLSSIIGLFLLGHFELNRYDIIAYLLHYVGAGFITLGGMGMIFIDEFSSLSVGLTGGLLFFAAAFFIVGEIVPAYSDNVADVTFYSKLCISIEIIAFLHLFIILGFTMNASGQNQGNIWASPFMTLAAPTCEARA